MMRKISVIIGIILNFLLYGGDLIVLIPNGSSWHYFKGTTPPPWTNVAWCLIDFDDSSWNVGLTPIGYQINKNIGIVTDIGSSQSQGYLTVYLRKEFYVEDPYQFSELRLTARVDDGYIAWLNGEEIGRFNVPEGELSYSSSASSAVSDPVDAPIVVTNAWKLLKRGKNILAVHLFNATLTSTDLFFDTALLGVPFTDSPKIVRIEPNPGSILRELSSIQIWFDRPVEGVDPSDLLINGEPAMDIRYGEPAQFVFIIPQLGPGPVQISWISTHDIRDLAGNLFQPNSWNYVLDPHGLLPSIRINEFMASNRNTLRDEDGDSSDWIELYNTGEVWENLEGWFLTDEPQNLTKWRLPQIILPSGSYLIIFASGKNRTNPEGKLHTNFRLPASGGYLALVNDLTNVVCEVYYPEQYTDVSYGVDRLDPTIWGYFIQPTPGEPNSTSGEGFAPKVEFSKSAGTFIDPFYLELYTTPLDPTIEIRYTLDGSIPTASSSLYTGPILISKTTEVRARAFKDRYFPSQPTSAIYIQLSPTITNFESNLPIIILDNFGGGSIPASPVSKRQRVAVAVFAPGSDGRVRFTDQPVLVQRAGFNIRGSSTKGFPKSSYRIEFWDEFDNGSPVELLGLPPDPDWILYAPNVFDLPLIHNPFIFQVSNEIGQYAPRTRLVEVFVNTSGGSIRGPVPTGNYWGIYVLMEAVKRDPNRVNIEKLLPEHTREPEVSGGYLLKIDRADPDERTFNAAALSIIYQDPPGLEMVTPQRQTQANYIRNYLNAFYNALYGPNPDDPINGYPAYIDINSWIDHHLLNVVAMNVDAFRLSAYFYKPRGRPLHMGPIWDFDRSMGTSQGGDLRPFNPLAWMGSAPLGGGDYGTDFFNPNNVFSNPWYSRLFQRPDFWQSWIDRYQLLRDAQLSNSNIFRIIDWLSNQLREAQPRDLQRWRGTGASDPTPRFGTVTVKGYSHTFPGTYQGEVDFMKRWLADHLNFIDTNFLPRPIFNKPSGFVLPGSKVELIDQSGKSGTIIYYTTDGTDPRTAGGTINTSARVYTNPITITSNILIIARAYNPNHRNLTGPGNPPISSPWSGPAIALYQTQMPKVVINEWMASNTRSLMHPICFDFPDWIELYNPTDEPIDLTGFTISDKLWEPSKFVFPSGTLIKPHGYLLIWADGRTELNSQSGIIHVNFALDQSGEAIALFDPQGRLVDMVSFGPQQADVSQGRWPDGGEFIQKFNSPTPGFPNTSSGWPIKANFRYLSATIVINEWMPLNRSAVSDPVDGRFKDWFEIYNTTAQTIDLTGWSLTDDPAMPTKYVIPAGFIIPPHGYMVIWADGKPELTGLTTGIHTNFRLNSQNGAIGIYAPDGTQIDLVYYGPQQPDISQGRYPDGVKAPYFFFSSPTPGSSNVVNWGAPPVITNIQKLDSKIKIRWKAVNGKIYRLQKTLDIMHPIWIDLSETITATGEECSIEIPLNESDPLCFYRIVLVGP